MTNKGRNRRVDRLRASLGHQVHVTGAVGANIESGTLLFGEVSDDGGFNTKDYGAPRTSWTSATGYYIVPSEMDGIPLRLFRRRLEVLSGGDSNTTIAILTDKKEGRVSVAGRMGVAEQYAEVYDLEARG